MSDTKAEKQHLGNSASAAWFRMMLEQIGETQSSMVRFMMRNGDDRQATTILRNIQRMANGEARVSGEMRVVLTMCANEQKKRQKAAEASNASFSTGMDSRKKDADDGTDGHDAPIDAKRKISPRMA